MSGFEVIGVVLGTIPLIISAVEHYERAIQTVRVMQRRAKVMHALARSLRTEHRILENACETLLGGIVPTDSIKPLLAEPFGHLWQDDKISLEVERRLDHTAAEFKDLVTDIMEALRELSLKLDLSSDMQVKTDEATIGKRSVLKFAAIALNISQHEDAVNKIADTNRKLETLLAGNLRNETLRARTSKVQLFSRLQTIAWSIYNALRLSLSCNCAQWHSVNLGLPTPRLISRGQDVDSVVRKLDFHLTFVNEPQNLKGKGHNTWAWDEVLLRAADWPPKIPNAALGQPVPVSSTSIPKTKKSKMRGVRFAEFAGDLFSTSGASSATASLTPTRSAINAQDLALRVGDQGDMVSSLSGDDSTELRLSDLCDFFGSKRKSPNPKTRFGYVMDSSANAPRSFGVYYLNSSDGSNIFSAVSLKQLLDRQTRPPSLPRRHCIAAVAAASILNLHGTPWIPMKLTSQDLFFVQRNEKVEYDEVFVSRKLSDNTSVPFQPSPDDPDGHDGNPSLHALGVLLMEIMLWKSIHDFWDDVGPSYSDTPAQVLLNIRSDKGFQRTWSVLERIGFSGGPAYRDAVERCIKCDLQCDRESLDDDEFRDAVYHHVVAPLQNTAHITTAPMTVGNGQFTHS